MMKITARMNAVVNSENSPVKGFATIVINDEFVINDYKIVASKEGELNVFPPSIKVDSEYQSLVFIKDIGLRDKLTELVVKAYTEFEPNVDIKERKTYTLGEKDAKPYMQTYVAAKLEDGNKLAAVNLTVAKDMVLRHVNVIDSEKGPFVQFPQTSFVNKEGERQFRALTAPITAEARENAVSRVLKTYDKYIDALAKKAEKEQTQKNNNNVQENTDIQFDEQGNVIGYMGGGETADMAME